MNILVRHPIIFVFAVFILQSPSSAITADEQGRATVVAEHSTATLTYLTALSGAILGRIAAGQTVKLAELDEANAAAVLDAARTIFRASMDYDAKFGGQFVQDEFAFWILSDFTVTLSGGSLEKESCIAIQLARDLPGNGTVPTQTTVADVPAMPNLPTLDDIMNEAPLDTVARAEYLRARALTILEPFGEYRLKKAGVPIQLSRFVSLQTIKMSDLTEAEKTWLKAVYERFCLKAFELGKRVRVEEVSGRMTVGGIPTQWLAKLPPQWSDLGDVTVEFSVQYGPMIVPTDKAKFGERGGGWSLPKRGMTQ